MIDGKQLGTVGFAKIGTPYSEMDCQAFVEWCIAQCGEKIDLRGSNAWYRECIKNGAVMSPEECVRELGTVPAGAFLFIHAYDGGEEKVGYHDGLGNASHIGLVTGQGQGAIHSSSSKGCVCESKFQNKTIPNGGWNMVGLWNHVSYDYGPGPSPTPTPTPTPTPPAKEFAMVSSGGNGPVNTRKGPGKSYPQSMAGKLAEGTIVEVLKHKDGWANICCIDKNGAVWYCWMDETFLVPVDDPDENDSAAYPDDPDQNDSGAYDGDDQDQFDSSDTDWPPDSDDFTGDDIGGDPEETITITLTLSAAEARCALSVLEELADAIAGKVGRG